MSASVDHDAPQSSYAQQQDEDLAQSLATVRVGAKSGNIDRDEADLDEALGLLVADLSNLRIEDLTIPIPIQSDEFTCSRCFLVLYESRLANRGNGPPICGDCI
jgi:hypothetical protein